MKVTVFVDNIQELKSLAPYTGDQNNIPISQRVIVFPYPVVIHGIEADKEEMTFEEFKAKYL